MRTKPMVVILIPLIVGIIIGWAITINLTWLLIFMVCVIVLVIILHKLRLNTIATAFFLFSVVCLGIFRFEYRDQGPFHPFHYRHQQHLFEKRIAVSGTVLADPLAQNGRFVTVFQLDSLFHNNSGRAVRGKIRLTVTSNHPTLVAGHYLKITGFLRKPTSARNPGAFDYADYLAVKRIYGIFRVGKQDSILITGHKNRPWFQLMVINPVRRSIKKRIKILMPPLQAALVQAMLLGERNEIPRELTSNLAKTGASHILAVSGLHTGLILIIIITVLRLLHVPARFRNPLTITALVFFCFLTGLNPPVVRASLMASFWLIGRQSQRFCDPLNIIATAATIILFINPLLLFTAGFQLSFGAVLGIILIRPVILKRLKSILQFEKMYHTPVLYGFIELVIATFSAQVAMMPLLIFHFSTLPLLGVVANLIAIPLLGLILPLGMVALLVSTISPFLAQFFVETNTLLISVLTITVEKLAQLPGSHTYCRLPALSSILFYYAALIAFLTFSPKIRKGMIISLLMLANLTIWGSAFTPRPLFRLIIFDVGQGDSALFLFKNGTQMLIDAGPQNKNYDAGRDVIGRFLRQNGIDHIDYLLITHPHNDHIGGVPWLLKNIQVNTIIDNGIKTQSIEQEEVYRLRDSLTIKHQIWRTGHQLSIDAGCEVYVISPPKDIPPLKMTHFLENHFSIIIRVVCQKQSVLLCGDAEKLAEMQLRPFGEMLNSSIIKIGHHGSIGASSKFFLRQVAPEAAVISVGKYNRFNQPHPKLLDRLQNLPCEILRTDVNGAIVFEAYPASIRQVNWSSKKSGRLRIF